LGLQGNGRGTSQGDSEGNALQRKEPANLKPTPSENGGTSTSSTLLPSRACSIERRAGTAIIGRCLAETGGCRTQISALLAVSLPPRRLRKCARSLSCTARLAKAA